jgi:excisionase family DNA binding protein
VAGPRESKAGALSSPITKRKEVNMFTVTATLPRTRTFWRHVSNHTETYDINDTPLVLTITEACIKLRISRWSLYQLIHTRQLATIKIGRRRVIPVAAIHEFIDRVRDEDDL